MRPLLLVRPALRVASFASLIALAACSSSASDEGSDSGLTDTGGRGGRGGTGGDAGQPPQDAAVDTEAPDAAPDTTTGSDVSVLDDLGRPTDTGGTTDTAPPDVRDRVSDGCAQVSATGDPVFAPVDIIWAIDTSGSMNEEAALVQEKLNDFVEFIEGSGLNVRVVMIGGDTVCVPEPLSGGGCPDADSARYRHVRRVVGSHDAFEAIVQTYPQYSDFLRREARTHFVVVSDDESAREANWFNSQMAALGRRSFVFHAIVSLVQTGVCPFTCEGCSGPYGDAEAKGDRYIVASEMTGGTASSICEPDWTPIFEGIGDNVIAGAVLPCTYAIPDLGDGLEIWYDQVDVTINGVLLTHHEGEAGCATAPGWYYDDNAAPTTIHICSSFCGGGFEGDEIAIEFGCVKG